MRFSRIRQIVLLSACLVLFNTIRTLAGPGGEMAAAATNFLNALTPEQRTQATFTFADDERFDWHFIPKARKGIPFKAMDSAQQKLAHALLSSGLSQRGYLKAVTIMSLDQILKDMG